MRPVPFILRSVVFLLIFGAAAAHGQSVALHNATITAKFGTNGLVSLQNSASNSHVDLVADRWSLEVDHHILRSEDVQPAFAAKGSGEIAYNYDVSGYQVVVTYRLRPGWHFVSKEVTVLRAPKASFIVEHVMPLALQLSDSVQSAFVPSSYLPQLGESIEQTRKTAPAKDFGLFLRLPENSGMMLTVQNPYLNVKHDDNTANLSYSPEMEWKQEWGTFSSDIACIGLYRQSGEKLPREMVLEWNDASGQVSDDGMDRAEIAAFTECVRAFLIHPETEPTSVEVGWTLNDYQIDVGTEEGKAEYKRVIDTAASLGIHHLLYAPGNSKLAERTESADSWSWEYVLWLNMGQKIRKGEWDPAKDALPSDVTEMVAYAKRKSVGLLAYVYPSVPYAKNSAWLVKRQEGGDRFAYATLASREFQDYLLHNLIAFQKRTGITGYSFDYAFFNLPGSSSYAQWYGWRRVMEGLRRAVPQIVIDGRQSYQQYGPWSWLAGTYPHPTGTDEQPESFKPYPDLHFDRVSADRTRFVNYWYRNYQFAPAEVIPGYATHQTERSMNVTGGRPGSANGSTEEKTIYTRYLPRDWDYLGFRYSFLSSIATGGWNNVVDMIPARDEEEWKHFSEADRTWIRNWLKWTVEHKEYLRNTRTILNQPGMGNVDGTSAMVSGRGYLFIFNPNYKQMSAKLKLDERIGLTQKGRYLLREIYPRAGRVIGKPGAGVWSEGDNLRLALDGTSATVIEVLPAKTSLAPVVFNAAGVDDGVADVKLKGDVLEVMGVEGEPGSTEVIGVLMPKASKITKMLVNNRSVTVRQTGRHVSADVHFEGIPFHQAQQVAITVEKDGALTGTFIVPRRVLDQLAARKRAWSIPWTTEDFDTTWLAPERLLLFVQFAEGNDGMQLSASLDGKSLRLKAAYSSTRVHSASFVGYYADLSAIAADIPHTFSLKLSQSDREKLQGVFFDNVESQFTKEILP